MDITSLEYFKLIAELNSLTLAAKELHVTQPAMSAILKKLEAELGIRLFDRTSNSIRLNRFGEIALDHTNAILKQVSDMKKDLAEASQMEQSLSIAFCGLGIRTYCVQRFSKAYPNVRLLDKVYTGKRSAELLLDHAYDVIVTPHKIIDEQIESQAFFRDRVFLSVPLNSNLTKLLSISLRELHNETILYPEVGGYFLDQIEHIIESEGLTVKLIKNSSAVTHQLIRTTDYLATVSTLSRDLRSDETDRSLIPFSDPELNILYHISYLKSNSDKAEVFLQWVRSLH